MGEIIGAVAVVVSIVYLARQINQGNRAARAMTMLEASKLLTESHGRANLTADLAWLCIKGTAGTSAFPEHEKARFLAVIAELFLLLDGLYRQYTPGSVAAEAWRPLEKALAHLA